MRIVFFLAASCLLLNAPTLAGTPDFTLAKENTDTGSIAKRSKILLGFNATQVIVGDVELHAMLRFKKRYSLMVGAGYDFNFLDFGNDLSPEDQCISCNYEREAESNASGRYFWGNGPAVRFVVTDNFSKDNGSHFFVSLYTVLKYHNYNNYYYGDDASSYSESAEQQIFGVGFYLGYEILKKNFLIRPYGGFGLRTIESHISRPETYEGSTLVYPGTKFTESYAYPAIDFGLIFLFAVRK